jgi:hypothetical protein
LDIDDANENGNKHPISNNQCPTPKLDLSAKELERHISDAIKARDSQGGWRAGQALRKAQTLLKDLCEQWGSEAS